MGMFSKTFQAVARAAVGAASVATSATQDAVVKQYQSAQKLMDTTRNTASLVRPSSTKKR